MLIDDIITRLSNEDATLSEALLKTKILLHKIGKKDLVEWVNYELSGYPDTAELPEYRVLPSRIQANVSNASYRISNSGIPVNHLPDYMKKDLLVARLHQSLSVLEQMTAKEATSLTRPIPMEFHGIFNNALGNGFRVESVWAQTQIHDVKGIFIQVRSRLLDFLLELKDGFGEISGDESMKEKADTMDTAGMFRQAVFGDNATVIMGANHKVSIQNEVRKGDLASLGRALAKAGLPDDEIDGLKEAVTDDEAGEGVSLSKGETGNWFLRLLERAGKGGLKIGTDVAAHAVTDALTAYVNGN